MAIIVSVQTLDSKLIAHTLRSRQPIVLNLPVLPKEGSIEIDEHIAVDETLSLFAAVQSDKVLDIRCGGGQP